MKLEQGKIYSSAELNKLTKLGVMPAETTLIPTDAGGIPIRSKKNRMGSPFVWDAYGERWQSFSLPAPISGIPFLLSDYYFKVLLVGEAPVTEPKVGDIVNSNNDPQSAAKYSLLKFRSIIIGVNNKMAYQKVAPGYWKSAHGNIFHIDGDHKLIGPYKVLYDGSDSPVS